MNAKDSKALKSSALLVAIVFASCVVCSASGYFFFGSSKVSRVFGASADALAGDQRVEPSTKQKPLTKKVMRDLLDGGP